MDGPSRPLEGGHAVGDALVRAQMSGGIAAVVVAVVGQPLPTISGKVKHTKYNEIQWNCIN